LGTAFAETFNGKVRKTINKAWVNNLSVASGSKRSDDARLLEKGLR